MKKLFIGLLIVVFVVGVSVIFLRRSSLLQHALPTRVIVTNAPTSHSTKQNTPAAAVIVENLDTPWAIAFLPDKTILVTERFGRVTRIAIDGKTEPALVANISGVKEFGEGGLLGIALHPDFVKNNYVYLYYTYSNSANNVLNRLVRMTYSNNTLQNEQVIVDKIPGSSNHNGGRIKFGPDGLLYIGTGDAQNPSQAQDTRTLGGKILRVTDGGKVPSDNPFNNAVYSYGHRNVQGLAWDNQKELWATEHGRSGVNTGDDEINYIVRGNNYGWPVIEDTETKESMQTPAFSSGPNVTWAPSGAAFLGASMFFSGLKGQTLYEAVIENNNVVKLREHLKGKYGRLREVIVGPDGMLYLTTSNKDGRGYPGATGDKIIRINPSKF